MGRNRIVTLGLAGALLLVTGAAANAQTKAAPAETKTAPAQGSKPGVVRVDTVELTGKVDAVDKDKRTVTVTGPRGRTATLKVGPDVKNFDQIKAGDQIKLRYLDSIALFVRKPDDPPAATEGAAVAVAPKGQKPAAVMVETKEVTATVEAVDYDKRTLTLKGPEGNTRTIKVDPAVKRLKEVKKGDQIVARHTEGVAISVVTPK
jgi:hypothetical protein